MLRSPGWRGLAAVATALCATAAHGALLASGVAARAMRAPARQLDQPRARQARALSVTDTARLHYVSASGSLLYEVGQVGGTLPGSMRARFNVGATMRGSFTFYAHGGSIRGRGSARLHGSGVYESFAGSLVATGGSGRYAHAHGQARLYGTFNRNSYALVVQTIGVLRY